MLKLTQFSAVTVLALLGLLMPGAAEERLNVLGSTIVVKADGETTAGAMAVTEALVPPGSGPPMHVHAREDELFYVLEGQFKLWRGEEALDAGPGDVAFMPRNVPHTYQNVGSEPGRLLVTIKPAGFEDFFRAASERGLMPPEDMAEIVALGKDYGLEFLGPPPGN
jgi:mannose-6-phosphate isomerase-like protein (cupin superfamily)